MIAVSVHPSLLNSWLIEQYSLFSRFGQPEDIGGIVSFLCSSDAAYITGENIVVGGGMPSRLWYPKNKICILICSICTYSITNSLVVFTNFSTNFSQFEQLKKKIIDSELEIVETIWGIRYNSSSRYRCTQTKLFWQLLLWL